MKNAIFILAIVVIVLTSFKQKFTEENREDFKKYYDQFHVKGSFVLFDSKAGKYIHYNKEQYKQPFTPASTFKICNSLIGLEAGVIKDENFVIPWDGITRQNPNWNQDHTLKTAYQNSTVWYYQELARQVGGKQMKHWLDKVKYGNADTSGGIDKFWITGGLRITPEQQLNFLQRLHKNKLPFSKRSVSIVKNIMIAKDTLGYVVRAKAGWGFQNNEDIGWYVGYVETNGSIYYFANCIQSADPNNHDFARARVDITYMIIDELKITKK